MILNHCSLNFYHSSTHVHFKPKLTHTNAFGNSRTNYDTHSLKKGQPHFCKSYSITHSHTKQNNTFLMNDEQPNKNSHKHFKQNTIQITEIPYLSLTFLTKKSEPASERIQKEV